MKILIYVKHLKLIEKSGIGRAIRSQIKAFKEENIEYTLNPKDDYDVVHINTVFPSSYFFSKHALKKGKKVIVHAHSTEEDFRNSFLFSNLISPLFKKWIIKCYMTGTEIVTPTRYSKSLLESYGIDKPIHVVSNGVDTTFFNRNIEEGQEFRRKYNYSKDEKIIMSVGLYFERKGIVDFVELAKQMPQYKFIWFGYMNPRCVSKKAREAVNTKLSNLTFAGYVKKEELKKAYSGCDLFFFPTYEETEGIVVLEALSMEIPVLLRNIPVYDDWINDNVDVYKADSVQEFSEKIQGILENRLKLLVKEGKKKALERDLRIQGRILVNI